MFADWPEDDIVLHSDIVQPKHNQDIVISFKLGDSVVFPRFYRNCAANLKYASKMEGARKACLILWKLCLDNMLNGMIKAYFGFKIKPCSIEKRSKLIYEDECFVFKKLIKRVLFHLFNTVESTFEGINKLAKLERSKMLKSVSIIYIALGFCCSLILLFTSSLTKPLPRFIADILILYDYFKFV